MKTAVLDFLKNSDNSADTFNQGYQLLLKTPGASNALLRNYNVKGYTPQSLETLIYDLKKLHGITDSDINNHVVEESAPQKPAKEYDETLFLKANSDAFSNILKEMNDEEKTGLKFFNQYPFLRDENCPNEFKILTNDAITAFHKFNDAHTELFEKVVMPENVEISNEEIYKIASGLLEKFELNHEIHAELEHFAKTNEILGEHEIFAELKKQRAVEGTTDLDLKQKIRNLSAQISKAKKALSETKDKEKKAELSKKVSELTAEKTALEETFANRQKTK